MYGKHEAIAQLDPTLYSEARRRIVGINKANNRLVCERWGGVSTTRTEAIRWVEVDGARLDVAAYIDYLRGISPYPGQPPGPVPWAPAQFEAVSGYVVDGPGQATRIHPTRQHAETEAMRLAGSNHGVAFNVRPVKLCAVVSRAITPKPVAKLEKCDE